MAVDPSEKVQYILQLLDSSERRKLTDRVSSRNTSHDEEDWQTDESIEMIGPTNDSSKLLRPYWFEPTKPTYADSYLSETSAAQSETEEVVFDAYSINPSLEFYSEAHLTYIKTSLHRSKPAAYVSLDANHPWMTYWLLNSYFVIKQKPIDLQTPPDLDAVAHSVESWINDDGYGGIGGGRGQVGHMASTYAAVLTLVLTESFEILARIRKRLYVWMMSLKCPDGSFKMHRNGESDTRSLYCVLVVASLLNITTPELLNGVETWLNRCQTYEGGFSGTPCTEAHGGYTYCGVSSYFLLHREPSDIKGFDLALLTDWLVSRQSQSEGGVNGRSNKLVDVCYAFWVGGVFPLIEMISGGQLFHRYALENYILRCAQVKSGGFRDKPRKHVDFYHTNYSLLGLSITQNVMKFSKKNSFDALAYAFDFVETENSNTVAINPIFGIPCHYVTICKKYFVDLDSED
ncbi:protein farnesyltransferase subunit beta [Diutina catenulata]